MPATKNLPKQPYYIAKLNQLHFHEKVILGQFTCTHRAHFLNGSTVKTVLAKLHTDATNPQMVKNFREGARILARLRHPHILNLIALIDDPQNIVIPIAVFEFFSGRTLIDHLIHNNAALSLPVRLRVAMECAQALTYLHQNHIVFRQMCASNVILSNKDLTSKLAEYNPNRVNKNKTDSLPLRWLAPEVLKRSHFVIKSDVWTYGIFLMELFMDGQRPYPDVYSETEVVEKLTNCSLYRMVIPMQIPGQLRDIIKMCWEEIPDKRPRMRMLSKQISKLIVE